MTGAIVEASSAAASTGQRKFYLATTTMQQPKRVAGNWPGSWSAERQALVLRQRLATNASAGQTRKRGPCATRTGWIS